MTDDDIISIATEQKNEVMNIEGESEEEGNSDHMNGIRVC